LRGAITHGQKQAIAEIAGIESDRHWTFFRRRGYWRAAVSVLVSI
jgi:hypothetical protein